MINESRLSQVVLGLSFMGSLFAAGMAWSTRINMEETFKRELYNVGLKVEEQKQTVNYLQLSLVELRIKQAEMFAKFEDYQKIKERLVEKLK